MNASPSRGFAPPRGAKVDRAARAIYGFSVATAGPAIGQGITFTRQTLADLHRLIVAAGDAGVTINGDHPLAESSASANLSQFLGVAKNPALDAGGDILRADFFAAPATVAPQADAFLERCDLYPASLGASVNAAGHLDGEEWRAENLFSIDFVAVPAANPRGLFAARRADVEGSDKMAQNAKTGGPPDAAEKTKAATEPSKCETVAAKAAEEKKDDAVKVAGEMDLGGASLDALIAELAKRGYSAEPREESEAEHAEAETDAKASAVKAGAAVSDIRALAHAAGLSGADESRFLLGAIGRPLEAVRALAITASAKLNAPVGSASPAPAPRAKHGFKLAARKARYSAREWGEMGAERKLVLAHAAIACERSALPRELTPEVEAAAREVYVKEEGCN